MTLFVIECDSLETPVTRPHKVVVSGLWPGLRNPGFSMQRQMIKLLKKVLSNTFVQPLAKRAKYTWFTLNQTCFQLKHASLIILNHTATLLCPVGDKAAPACHAGHSCLWFLKVLGPKQPMQNFIEVKIFRHQIVYNWLFERFNPNTLA